MSMQDGCRAELQGVTFTGRTELGASQDAPSISRVLSFYALGAFSSAQVSLKGDPCVNACIVSCCFPGGCQCHSNLPHPEVETAYKWLLLIHC
jgi:hypothetical protein